jgi:ribonuclease BN (tRNA processing enzyme)
MQLIENLITYARNADILIHEVYSKSGFDKKPETWKTYHKVHHTSTYELAEIANQSNPGLIILYHILYWGVTDQDLLNEISETYKGQVVVGKDLGIYGD